MNVGSKRRLIWLFLAFAAAAAASAKAQPAALPWGLPQLMAALAQVHSATARFTERQTLHLLNAPLITSGTLAFVAPGYLRKTTLSPVAADFVLDNGQATMTTGPERQTQSFALAAAPQIAGLVEGIRATLAGDLATLNNVYVMRLSGTAAAWQLLLRPRAAPLTHIIRWMSVQGSQNRIDSIDTASDNGDHAEMGILETTVDAR